MDRDRLLVFRDIVKPFVKKRLQEINYENMGEIDGEEFERDFDTIIDLASSALEQKSSWVLVSDQMPEEREWIGTQRFGTTISDEVYVTFENPEGQRFTKHLSFQNGKLGPMDQQTIDAFYRGSVPIAWMRLPGPYKGEEK